MKILAFILSVYMMWLTTIACVDVPQDNTLHKIELTNQNQHNHQQNDNDQCSPFCSCNCCATSVIFHANIIQLHCFSSIEQQYFTTFAGFFSDPLASIWQPPKIA